MSTDLTPTGDWDGERAERFLRDRAVPVRLGCRTPKGGLWMLSLWYRYREGRLECATGADARIVEYLRADSDVAFEISTNHPPYMGVRGAGTATITPDEDKTVLRDLVERYLDGTDSSLAQSLLAPDREEVCIAVEPSRAYTWDFSDRMTDTDDQE